MVNQSPFQILQPDERWAPSHSQFAASNDEYERLPPHMLYDSFKKAKHSASPFISKHEKDKLEF